MLNLKSIGKIAKTACVLTGLAAVGAITVSASLLGVNFNAKSKKEKTNEDDLKPIIVKDITEENGGNENE